MNQFLAAFAILAATLPAQAPGNVIGTSRAVHMTRLTRPDGGTANADYLNRLDTRDYAHYFDDGNGNMVIANMELALNDANDLTTENWSAVWYGEDVGNPGHPDPSGPLLRVGPLPMPGPLNPGQPTNVTWYIGLSFSPELSVPNNQALFYGIGLEPAPNQAYPNDGLSILITTDNPSDAVRDEPGQAIGALSHGTYSVWTLTVNGLPSAPASYFPGTPGGRELLYCDMGGVGAGGTPIAVTNQASYTISNPGQGATGQGGTTSPFSGMHPDIFGWHAGRQDDPGFLLYDQSMIGKFAVIMAAFGGSAFTTPVATIPGIDPNSYGVLCIDLGAATTFFGLIDPNGFAQAVIPFSGAARTFVQSNPGLDLWWQGISLDVGGAQPVLHATGCAKQHL